MEATRHLIYIAAAVMDVVLKEDETIEVDCPMCNERYGFTKEDYFNAFDNVSGV